MKIFELVISILLPIFLGYFFKIIKIFNNEETLTLRKFVIKVSVPFIIFKNLYNSDFAVLNQLLPLSVSLFLMTLLFLLFSTLLCSKLIKDIPHRNSTILASMVGNYGYLGWGVMFYFYGDPGLTRSVFFTILFWPIFLFFGFSFIYFYERKNFSKKIFIKTLFKNASVPILSALIGIIFNFFNIKVPELLYKPILTFSNFTIPLILFTIGLNLSFKINLKELKYIFIASSIRLIFGIFIGYLTILMGSLLFKYDTISTKVVLLESIMPTAAMTPFFVDFIDSDEKLISAIITFSTLISLITIPFWYLIIENLIR